MEKDQIRLIQLWKISAKTLKEKDLREETIGHNKFKEGSSTSPVSTFSARKHSFCTQKRYYFSLWLSQDLISLRGKKDSAETVISALMNKSACMEESLERIA